MGGRYGRSEGIRGTRSEYVSLCDYVRQISCSMISVTCFVRKQIKAIIHINLQLVLPISLLATTVIPVIDWHTDYRIPSYRLMS